MTKHKIARHASALFTLALFGGLISPIPASAKAVEVCDDGICTVTFSYSGLTEVWYPPKNAKTISFQVRGAQGGDSGGFGGEVTGEFTSRPGKVFVTVGREGGFGNAAVGGFNGGGASGSGYFLEGSGGGASDIRLTQDPETRIVVAGGGGGRGSGPNSKGGAGGGLIGGSGSANGEFGGTGGTQSEGGFGANAAFSTSVGTAGELFFGGQGGSTSAEGWGGGGGGGGGYFGGGGGSGSELDPCCTYSSGGGGGSSFTDSNYTTNITHTQGNTFGDGQVTFSYQMAPTVSSISTPATFTNSDTVEFQITFNTPIENFDTLDIDLVHTTGSCQNMNLSGVGASFTLNLFDCSEGDLWIRVLENSVTAYNSQGPAYDFYSPVVRIDRTPPALDTLDVVEKVFTITFNEEISALPSEAIYFASEDPSCQIVRIGQVMAKSWQAELAGCDGVGHSFSILANSVQDYAGNIGPAKQANYVFTPDEIVSPPSPDPDESANFIDPAKTEPINDPKNEPSNKATPVLEVAAPPVAEQPELVIRDLELTTGNQRRNQAAQRVVIPREATRKSDPSVWPISLVVFAVIAFGAGLILVRRDLSNMVRG